MLALHPLRALLGSWDHTEKIHLPLELLSTCKKVYILNKLPDMSNTGFKTWLSCVKLKIERPVLFCKLPLKDTLPASAELLLVWSITIQQQLEAFMCAASSLTGPLQLQLLEYTDGQQTRRCSQKFSWLTNNEWVTKISFQKTLEHVCERYWDSL